MVWRSSRTDIASRLAVKFPRSTGLNDVLDRTAETLAQNAEAETNPFLEGATLTVAGAALLQRVSGAITAVGGSVQSSQVDINAGGKDGIVGLLINCEVEHGALQKLLFDLETGSPLLIVDQIDVQTPTTTTNDASVNQLRISLSVSGRWRGVK